MFETCGVAAMGRPDQVEVAVGLGLDLELRAPARKRQSSLPLTCQLRPG
jgi:hypothetical protein